MGTKSGFFENFRKFQAETATVPHEFYIWPCQSYATFLGENSPNNLALKDSWPSHFGIPELCLAVMSAHKQCLHFE